MILRHERIILDTALAELYNVSMKRLNEQAKRNRKGFPADFMFQLTPRENKRGGRRSLPYAFTEHGTIMAATVLNSEQAVNNACFVVRPFVRLRETLAATRELADGIGELEKHLETHDGTIQEIINVIKSLMTQPPRRRSKIGFTFRSTRTG
jgi:hypothetical protein